MLTADEAVPAVVALTASLFAAVTDSRQFKVHNRLTFPLALSGLIYHSWNQGTQGFLLSAAGLSAGLAILILPYALGALGAGDVKFFAAVSAWLGVAPMFTVLVVACIATGAYSAGMLVRQGGLSGLWLQLQITCWQLATFGRRGSLVMPQSSVQEVLATSPDYRRRLVPFTAMMGVGVLAAIVRQAFWIT